MGIKELFPVPCHDILMRFLPYISEVRFKQQEEGISSSQFVQNDT